MTLYYIAGPMTGYPELNLPAFHAAKEFLQSEGNRAITPADLDSVFGFDAAKLDFTIRIDFEAVMQCDSIYMLRGWEKSVGARAEHAIAVWRGIPVRYEVTQ